MRILLFAVLSFLLLGCAGAPGAQAPQDQPPAAPPPPSAPPSAPPTAPPSTPPATTPATQPDPDWATYSKIGISFDYPRSMSVAEQLSGYPGRANILIQGKLISEGAIAVNFVNMSGISSALPDPLEQAAKVLKSNTENEDDIAGQAQVRGGISTYLSPNGVPTAERSFILTKPGTSGNNVTMYGYALEFYDGDIKASYPVRIFSTNSTWTDEMKARLVASFRTGQ